MQMRSATPAGRRFGRWAGVRAAVFCALVGLAVGLIPSDAVGLGSHRISVACVGDVMLGRGVAEALDGDWAAAFAQVMPWLAEADLAFANLESPLTTASQLGEGYDLRASPEAVAALSTAGFDVVSLANNHAGDAGRAGWAETVAVLSGAGVAYSPPLVVRSVAGWRAAVLAFDDSAGMLDVGAAARAVSAAAEQAELVLVSVHWGGEYQVSPSERQRALADVLAGAGADAILGHGPHVLQPVEWDGGTLIAYSLGNFLFDQAYPADLRWGAVLRLYGQAGRVVAVEALPTVVERGRVRVAEPEEREAILDRLKLVTGMEPLIREAFR